jgi:methylation protein EvaC
MICNLTNKKITEVMTFGKMPLANGFLNTENISKEFFYEMTVGVSPDLGLFQLTNHPKPEMMFHDDYPFFTSSSSYMTKHFNFYADWIVNNFINENDKIIEIGCNDGTMLENFKKKNIYNIGIDPSKNVANIARNKNLNIINNFFSYDLANSLEKFKKNTKVICAANVICHIPDLKDLIKAVDVLLEKKGLFIFEEPYLGNMLQNVSYDQIYDEHIYIFSATSVEKIFNLFDFELIDLLPQVTHGGSMRYVVARKNQYSKSAVLKKIFTDEMNRAFLDINTYINFKNKCLESKERLIEIIEKNLALGKRICGYAATSKSTTILNYCSIGSSEIDCIYDSTVEKIGKKSPGMHIPIVNSSEFKNSSSDLCLLFGWNHKDEILKKEKHFLKNGGQWISHLKNFI